jgi:hypothetical protein
MTPFAATELPELKSGDERYLFDHRHEMIEFATGVDAMNLMDDDYCMVLRFSTTGQWAIDFERIEPESVESVESAGAGAK